MKVCKKVRDARREVHEKVSDARTTNTNQLEKDSAAVTLFRRNIFPFKKNKNLLIIFYNSKIPFKVQKKQVNTCECPQNAKRNSWK